MGYDTDRPIEEVAREMADALSGCNEDAVEEELRRVCRHFRTTQD